MSSDKDSKSIEQARELVERAHQAQKTLATFTQEKVDSIVDAMARAALLEAARLGELAYRETGY
jgi:acetaldehyde dehydrogenase (acetylating)